MVSKKCQLSLLTGLMLAGCASPLAVEEPDTRSYVYAGPGTGLPECTEWASPDDAVGQALGHGEAVFVYVAVARRFVGRGCEAVPHKSALETWVSYSGSAPGCPLLIVTAAVANGAEETAAQLLAMGLLGRLCPGAALVRGESEPDSGGYLSLPVPLARHGEALCYNRWEGCSSADVARHLHASPHAYTVPPGFSGLS